MTTSYDQIVASMKADLEKPRRGRGVVTATHTDMHTEEGYCVKIEVAKAHWCAHDDPKHARAVNHLKKRKARS